MPDGVSFVILLNSFSSILFWLLYMHKVLLRHALADILMGE